MLPILLPLKAFIRSQSSCNIRGDNRGFHLRVAVVGWRVRWFFLFVCLILIEETTLSVGSDDDYLSLCQDLKIVFTLSRKIEEREQGQAKGS